MAVSEKYLEFVVDQLSEVGDIDTKKMFGGIGFFKEGLMFAMIGNDSFRLKVDETNVQDFIDKGMKPYQSDAKKKGMPYWEVPTEILENKKELKKWAAKSISISQKKK